MDLKKNYTHIHIPEYDTNKGKESLVNIFSSVVCMSVHRHVYWSSKDKVICSVCHYKNSLKVAVVKVDWIGKEREEPDFGGHRD
jgi:hypothetical protein